MAFASVEIATASCAVSTKPRNCPSVSMSLSSTRPPDSTTGAEWTLLCAKVCQSQTQTTHTKINHHETCISWLATFIRGPTWSRVSEPFTCVLCELCFFYIHVFNFSHLFRGSARKLFFVKNDIPRVLNAPTCCGSIQRDDVGARWATIELWSWERRDKPFGAFLLVIPQLNRRPTVLLLTAQTS